VSLLVWSALFARYARPALGSSPVAATYGPGILAAAIAVPLAVAGRLVLAPDEASRWAQGALAVVLALAFVGLYAAAMVRWARQATGSETRPP
jgi:hypothetical protein